MASDPIASVAWLSVSAVQLAPALVLFQTPPPAVPAKITAAFVGSTARLVIRPLVRP